MNAERLTTESGIVIPGPLLITPRVFDDARGFFYESWNQHSFNGILEADGQSPIGFVQDNHSSSSKGVLRGLHFQKAPDAQGKLVRCIQGEIFDVAVDCRQSAPTFGHWVSARLSSENLQQLWVPVGFAHGFLTLSAQAEVLYKTTDFWNRESERSLLWSDPDLAISWPQSATPLLAEKDTAAPSWKALITAGDCFQ
jgi:dTDP-4-dehydrorhamnose 3,5-epimerase